jgi:hypothetical protein
VFCCGAAFLSLEVFELPYIMALLGVQLSLLTRIRGTHEPASRAEESDPALDGWQPLAS